MHDSAESAYFVSLKPRIYHFCVCLFSACPSVHGLERPGNELTVAAVTYDCFKLPGLFASSLQKEAKRCQYHQQ